jgi:PAS domain S-box-containing protein
LPNARVDDFASEAAGTTLRTADPAARGYGRIALTVLLVCAGYYAAGVVALSLRFEPSGLSAIWLPQSVLLSTFLLTPIRRWWVFLAALLPVHLHFASHFHGPLPPGVAIAHFAGGAVESVLGALAVRGFIGTPPRLDVFRNMTAFIVMGIVLPAMLVSAVVSGLLLDAGWIDVFRTAWYQRTLTSVCGALAMTPLIVGLANGGFAALRAAPLPRILEYVAATLGIVAVIAPALAGQRDITTQQALLFAPLPLLLWTAVRSGPSGLSPQLLIVALAVMITMKAGRGPFVAESVGENVLSAQLFLLAIMIPKLMVAALVAERRRSERVLDERLRFEQLVSEISAGLINPSPATGDTALEKALAKTVSTLRLDRCSVYQYSPGQQSCRITHSAESADCPPVRREMDESELPWLLRELRNRRTVLLSDVALDLPPEAVGERRYAEAYGSSSWLAIPIDFGDGVVRAVSYHSIRQRTWSAETVSRLRLLAEIFVSSVGSMQVKHALQANEARYREVVDSQTELVCRYTPDTTLTFVNEAYCRFFARRRDELIGRKFVELIPEASWPAVFSQVESLLREPRVCTYEHEVMLADGTIGWQQWVDSAIVAPDGCVTELQGIGRDITDRKRAEEATQRLAQASRLAMMGELTASIAHEVNQPLNAILNNADAAELLLDSGSDRLDEVRQILADIRNDDLRASEVIRRTRDLLRKRPMEREPLDLNEVAGSVLQFVRNDATRRGVELVGDFSRDLPPVPADRVHLEQALLNLILNGMEAMTDPGISHRRLTVRTAVAGGSVEVVITDSGHGIAPEHLSELFDSFFTTKQDGMGMGLSIARSIAEAHGGRVWAENRREGGATFRLTVPVELQ